MGLLLFIYPFAEIYAWYKFIELYSFWDAVLVVFTGGVLGLFIMMIQGRIALFEVQSSLAKGEVPASKALHRGLIMFGGLLIMLPGLLSKVAGTLLVLPGFRHLLALYLKVALAAKIAQGAFRVFTAGASNMGGMGGFSAHFGKGFPGPEMPSEDAPAERDVIEVTPQEITHKKIE